MKLHRSSLSIILMAGAALAASGCSGIRCETYSFLRYNPQADSFRCMQLYLNLRTEEAKELDHLKSIWDRRARLIINPLDPDIFGVTLFERTGKHDLQSFAMRYPGDGTTVPTKADLDSITILPGEFFLNDQVHLCFYQQVEIPGKVVDAFLEEISLLLAAEISKGTLELMREGAAQGKNRASWDDLRADLALLLFPHSETKDPGYTKNKLLPLDIGSIAKLIKTSGTRPVQLTRKGSVLKLFLPLSERDARETITTIEFLRRTAADRIMADKSVGQALEYLGALSPGVIEGEGILISIDMIQWVKAGHEKLDAVQSQQDARACISTVAAIEQRGAQVNRTLSIKPLLTEYGARWAAQNIGHH
jgi:hypothetical protein